MLQKKRSVRGEITKFHLLVVKKNRPGMVESVLSWLIMLSIDGRLLRWKGHSSGEVLWVWGPVWRNVVSLGSLLEMCRGLGVQGRDRGLDAYGWKIKEVSA